MSDTQATHRDPDAENDQAGQVEPVSSDAPVSSEFSPRPLADAEAAVDADADAEDAEDADADDADQDDTDQDDTDQDGPQDAEERPAASRPETDVSDVSDASDAADDGAQSDEDVAEPSASGKVDRKARVRQLEREGEVAADFLETLLDIADLDGDIDVDVDGDRAAVAIVDSEEGRVPRRLVGPDGKVLEALQELTRLAVQVETGERSRLMLDIAGHRAERRSTLVSLAQQAIAEVKESGSKRALEPMSAFERKVVHDEVAAAGLVSESEGEEPKRHVVILPASA